MRLTRIACTIGAMLAATPLLAATFPGMGSANPPVVLVGHEVTFSFPVAYPVTSPKVNKDACGIKVVFGDGVTKYDSVQQSMYPMAYTVKHSYNKASADQPFGGVYITTLTPEAHSGLQACSGNGNTAKVTVNAAIAVSPALLQAAQPPKVVSSAAAVVAALAPPEPVAVLTMVAFGPNWFDATNNLFLIDTYGKKGAQCGVQLELTHVDSGVSKHVLLDHVAYPTTTSYNVNWPNAPAGNYRATAKPLPPGSGLVSPTGGALPSCDIQGGSSIAMAVLKADQIIKKAAVVTIPGGAAAAGALGPAVTAGGLIDTTPTTGVDLVADMARSVYPAGVAQTFKLTSNTGGKSCHFSVVVSGPNGPIFNKVYDTPLPWTSPDYALGNNQPGQQYTIAVKALAPTKPGPSACKGAANLSYQVVYEIGALTNVTLVQKSVATGQTVDWTINGKSFGVCEYTVNMGTRGAAPDLSYKTNKQLPNHITKSYDNAGQFYVNADETLHEGNPVGCAGHVKSDFVTVLARPVCPAPQYAYKSPDDNDYGCVFPTSVQSSITETFSCPAGYSVQKSVLQEVQYGCHRDTSPLKQITTAMLSGGASAVVAAAGGGVNPGGKPSGPQLDTPTITKVQLVAASGGAPRPNSNIFYAGEDLQVDISGNVTNNGGWNIFKCGYEVQLENIDTNKTSTFYFTNFTIHSLGGSHPPGDYRVKAVPKSTEQALPCAGSATTGTFKLHRRAAWLTDLKLKGYGYHFNMADAMGLPQFCEACSSIFSPAHNSAFLITTPVFGDGGPACAYSITQNGGTAAEVYNNGKAIPPGQEEYPPFMSKWGDAKNTVTVTVKGLEGLPVPACNGSITKTITFTDNPDAAAVYK